MADNLAVADNFGAWQITLGVVDNIFELFETSLILKTNLTRQNL